MSYKATQQTLRQVKIVAALKRGNQVNTQTFADYLRAHEDEPGAPMACSARTVARDIQHLQEELNAPIEYDDSNRTYVLTDPNWNFTSPVFDEDFVSMSMLGVQLAEGIVPEPLRTDLEQALDQTLTSNSSEFFDVATMDTLLCASGVKAHIEPAVFKRLFDAWRRKQCVRLDYRDPQGKESSHDYEPQLIAFHKGHWYAKGYLAGTKELRVFSCQRIIGVEPLGRSFTTDQRLLATTKREGLFNYPKIAGIRLHCDASIAFYIREQQKTFQSKLEEQPDGSLIVNLNPTVEHEVVRWILGEGGRIQVLEPAELRAKIAAAGREITRRNG